MSEAPEVIDYLLGELEPAARRRFEERVARDPALRAEVARLRPLVAGLAQLDEESWDVVAPAPPAPAARPREAPRRRWMAVAAGVAALAVAAGVGVLVRGGGGGDDAPALALERLPDPAAGAAAGGRARLVSGGREVEVELRGLRPSGAGSRYEVWLLDGPEATRALGTVAVPASGVATVRVPAPADLDRYRYLDVSIEPRDGDPAHSGRSVLRAEAEPLTA